MKRLLLGMVAACMATSMVAQDPATYEKAGEYTLENLWMKAATTGNNMGVADQLGGANDSRGMTVKGDEMLFAYRAAFTGIKIYDLKTGDKKRDVQFDAEKFKITYTYTKIDTIVNAPGYFPSELTGAYIHTPEFKKVCEDYSPMGRPGITGEMDGLCIYLASDASSFTTGQMIAVDGGWLTI